MDRHLVINQINEIGWVPISNTGVESLRLQSGIATDTNIAFPGVEIPWSSASPNTTNISWDPGTPTDFTLEPGKYFLYSQLTFTNNNSGIAVSFSNNFSYFIPSTRLAGVILQSHCCGFYLDLPMVNNFNLSCIRSGTGNFDGMGVQPNLLSGDEAENFLIITRLSD